MITYQGLVDYLVEVGKRHPNVRYVEFDTDVDSINDPKFVCPAFIISPAPVSLGESSMVTYSFQLLYLDKMNETGEDYSSILEDAMHFMLGYIAVVDLKYKIVKGTNIEPVLIGYDGGLIVGQQAVIQIEDIYNIEKFMTPFYGNE